MTHDLLAPKLSRYPYKVKQFAPLNSNKQEVNSRLHVTNKLLTVLFAVRLRCKAVTCHATL